MATRDSKQADAGPALLFGSPQWGAFVRHLGDTAHWPVAGGLRNPHVPKATRWGRVRGYPLSVRLVRSDLILRDREPSTSCQSQCRSIPLLSAGSSRRAGVLGGVTEGCGMAAATSKAVGIAVVATVGAVLVFGAQTVWNTVTGWFTGGTEIIADGEYSFMIASEDKSKVKKCSAREVVTERQCDGLRIVVFDARKMPYIARGIGEAWESGLPAVLTMDRAKEDVNRAASCRSKRYKKNYPNTSCDEYPMAPTEEGGERAHMEEVPKRENLCQGGTVRWQYPEDGKRFWWSSLILKTWHQAHTRAWTQPRTRHAPTK
ncbi:protein of unknown function [Actinokineospora iranica]|uniref:Deoxyribonuclease NucA/NucB domain-containing protein n=1 Tax=Actinokineospora iranica TaxID=1271860 RepID=A0A1G6T0Q0_9PSEU|nr:protein of unknown function [Actinokineospora iranica]